MKTKAKSYGDRSKGFNDKDILKVSSNYTCLAIILIDFLPKKDKNYITDDLEFSSDDSDESGER